MNKAEIKEIVLKLEAFYETTEFKNSDNSWFHKEKILSSENLTDPFSSLYVSINFGIIDELDDYYYYLKVHYTKRLGYVHYLVREKYESDDEVSEKYRVICGEDISFNMAQLLVQLHSLAFDNKEIN